MKATATATANTAVEQYLERESFAKLRNVHGLIANYSASFEKDWEYAFVWKAADMYAAQVEQRLLNTLFQVADKQGYAAAYMEMDKYLTQFIDNVCNIRESSTNAISNEASTIKYRAYHALRSWLREVMQESVDLG
jgi:hypothetical protein